MTITSYTTLCTDLTNWLGRSDLTSYYDNFISGAEQRLWYGSDDASPFPSDPLRCRGMETSTTIVTSAQTVNMPSDMLEVRRMVLQSSPLVQLIYQTPDHFWSNFTSTATSKPT